MQRWLLNENRISETTARLPLTNLRREIVAYTFIDVSDWDDVNARRWHLHDTDSGSYVARTSRGARVYLHRYLMSAPAGLEVDHRDRNGLNNCRSNLRLATRAFNAQNLPVQRGKIHSQFRGVTKDVKDGKWVAQVWLNGKNNYLGRFTLEAEAAEVARAFRQERMPFSEL